MFANASHGICLVRLLFFVEYPSSFSFFLKNVLYFFLFWVGTENWEFLFCLAQFGCLCFAVVF